MRELDEAATFKRIGALDALYANYCRRQEEFMALPKGAGYEAFSAVYDGMVRAKRAYEECRDTPYRLARDPS